MDVINHNVLNELKEVMEDDFGLLIETFLADGPERINDLRNLMSSGADSEMEKPAHTLKGSSSNIGAMKLSQACADLVDQVRAGSITDASSSVSAIESEFEAAKAVLLTYL